MAQPSAQSPIGSSSTKTDGLTAGGANGHYVNGSAPVPEANSERTQIINDEKEFKYVLDT